MMAQRERTLKRKFVQHTQIADLRVAEELRAIRNGRITLRNKGGGARQTFNPYTEEGAVDLSVFHYLVIDRWDEYGRMWQTATLETSPTISLHKVPRLTLPGPFFLLQAWTGEACDDLIGLHRHIIYYLERCRGHIESSDPFLEAFRTNLWHILISIEKNLLGFIYPTVDRRNIPDSDEEEDEMPPV